MVYGGTMVFAGERAAESPRSTPMDRGGLPDELTTILNLTTAPPAPFLPESVHGKPVAVVAACSAGAADEGERRWRRSAAWATPWPTSAGRCPTSRCRSCSTRCGARHPQPHESRLPGRHLRRRRDAMLRGWASKPSPKSELHVHHMGGAAAPGAATARPSHTATLRTWST